jgi:hypothetical protein
MKWVSLILAGSIMAAGVGVSVFGLGTIFGIWNEKSLDTSRATWTIFGAVILMIGVAVMLSGLAVGWAVYPRRK